MPKKTVFTSKDLDMFISFNLSIKKNGYKISASGVSKLEGLEVISRTFFYFQTFVSFIWFDIFNHIYH